MIREMFQTTRDVITRIDLAYVAGPVVGISTNIVMNRYPATDNFSGIFGLAMGGVAWGFGVICRGEYDAYQKRKQSSTFKPI